MNHPGWKCPKCGHDHFETGQLRAPGSGLAAVFDVQNRRFSTVTCARCTYTEIYRASSDSLTNVLDFFTQ